MEMTMTSQDKLIRKFSQAIRNGNAAIFAGAGLSRASGFVDWKKFLKPLACELNLDIEKETDYLAVAQYYRNTSGSRSEINQEILNTFNSGSGMNENIEILTRLPIVTYWTTNYDKLIETGIRNSNRKVDVKINSDQLATTLVGRDAVVYKMHGDVDSPANAVLIKDDYVLYDKKRPLFRTILQGDLISKKFLFLGFSFEDPNFDYILGQIRALLDENMAEHYCIFKRVQKSDYKSDAEYGYELAKQDLRVQDLARYGIQTGIVVELMGDICTQIENDIHYCIEMSIDKSLLKRMKIDLAPEITEANLYSILQKYPHILKFIQKTSNVSQSKYAGTVEMNLCKKCEYLGRK